MHTKPAAATPPARRDYAGPAQLEPLIRRRDRRRATISVLAAEKLGLRPGAAHDASSVYRRINAMFGDRLADELATKPEEIEAWEAQQVIEGLASATIAKHRSFLSTLFVHAIRTGAARTNPVGALTQKVRARTRDRGRAKLEVLLPAEFSAICFDARIPWWRRLAWRFLILTGAREGEAIGALHRDYSPPSPFRCGEILIARQWSTKRRAYSETKTEDIRHVPAHRLWDETYAWALLEYRAQVGVDPRPDDPLLTYFRPGHPGVPQRWNARTILRWWHKDLTTCEIAHPAAGKRRLHGTRHTFITTLFRAGAPERLIRSITHADAEARDAFARYVHTDWPDMAKAVQLLAFDSKRGRRCA